MNEFLYLLVLGLLSPLLLAFWVEGLASLASLFDPAALKWFGLGLLAAFVVELLLRGAITRFIEFSVHELTHALTGAVFLHGTDYMEVTTDRGGLTRIPQGAGNPFIALAPYYLPLFTIPLLLAKPFVGAVGGEMANNVLDLLIGLTLGFHYALHRKQFSPAQPDLQVAGCTASIGITYTLMLIFLVIAVAVVAGNYGAIAGYFANVVARAPQYYQAVFSAMDALLAHL